VPLEQQLDEMSLAQPGRPSRDRCRTPMPWSVDKNAGFTAEDAVPWLPLGDHSTINVQSEQAAPTSVLNFWHQLSLLRSAGRIGTMGTLERVQLDDQVWAFRVGGATTVANLSDAPAKASLGAATAWSVLVSSGRRPQGGEVPGELDLEPWEALVVTSVQS
jgi:glycosidase